MTPLPSPKMLGAFFDLEHHIDRGTWSWREAERPPPLAVIDGLERLAGRPAALTIDKHGHITVLSYGQAARALVASVGATSAECLEAEVWVGEDRDRFNALSMVHETMRARRDPHEPFSNAGRGRVSKATLDAMRALWGGRTMRWTAVRSHGPSSMPRWERMYRSLGVAGAVFDLEQDGETR